MRMASLLLFAMLLSCLSFQACAIEAGDIAAPSIKAANMKMPKPIITSPNMDMPEPKKELQVIPDSNANQIDNQTQVTKGESDDLSGKWSIKFGDRPDRSLDLTLWSSGRTKIMGYGTLTKGSTSSSVTVSGSLAGEELTLAVQSAESESSGQKSDKYDLSLIMANNTSNNTMSGTYILSVGGEFMGDGNITAIKR
ncbi:MAG: hypothetical protein QG575_1334 [Euryarchaeota archaeon]|nr:hypothetical protein [Euryarchaeota archaeon]